MCIRDSNYIWLDTTCNCKVQALTNQTQTCSGGHVLENGYRSARSTGSHTHIIISVCGKRCYSSRWGKGGYRHIWSSSHLPQPRWAYSFGVTRHPTVQVRMKSTAPGVLFTLRLTSRLEISVKVSRTFCMGDTTRFTQLHDTDELMLGLSSKCITVVVLTMMGASL